MATPHSAGGKTLGLGEIHVILTNNIHHGITHVPDQDCSRHQRLRKRRQNQALQFVRIFVAFQPPQATNAALPKTEYNDNIWHLKPLKWKWISNKRKIYNMSVGEKQTVEIVKRPAVRCRIF